MDHWISDAPLFFSRIRQLPGFRDGHKFWQNIRAISFRVQLPKVSHIPSCHPSFFCTEAILLLDATGCNQGRLQKHVLLPARRLSGNWLWKLGIFTGQSGWWCFFYPPSNSHGGVGKGFCSYDLTPQTLHLYKMQRPTPGPRLQNGQIRFQAPSSNDFLDQQKYPIIIL